eukprot:583009_1
MCPDEKCNFWSIVSPCRFFLFYNVHLRSMIASCFDVSYDILAQIISILDVITDIIVCIGFYQNDRMILFGISITILCLALVAYDTVFVMKFSQMSGICRDIGLFVCLLPISPFIPFMFYFAGSREKQVSQFIETHWFFKRDNLVAMEFPGGDVFEDTTELRKFMDNKIKKHIGFILEALVEVFSRDLQQTSTEVAEGWLE